MRLGRPKPSRPELLVPKPALESGGGSSEAPAGAFPSGLVFVGSRAAAALGSRCVKAPGSVAVYLSAREDLMPPSFPAGGHPKASEWPEGTQSFWAGSLGSRSRPLQDQANVWEALLGAAKGTRMPAVPGSPSFSCHARWACAQEQKLGIEPSGLWTVPWGTFSGLPLTGVTSRLLRGASLLPGRGFTHASFL